jgi:hypothetical protein
MEVVWSGCSKKFHYQWLRDHCPCPLCKHPSNSQKLHRSGDVNLVIPKAKLEKGNLELYWPENSLKTSAEPHKTVFCLDFLKTLDITDNRNYHGILWDTEILSKSAGLHFDYNHAFTDHLKFRKLLRQLYDYGIVFLHNVPKNNTQVEMIASHFGNIRTTFYGTCIC